ncbi:MAG TPA: MFS transporter [Candidatus Dormibacteraeota bacterium]|jgi:MFS family permease|nr:MFS transporter [Candidatus Dormibacteraeota bacterium]
MSSSKPTPLTSYQFRLLAVLALINFVNFAARQVFGPLIPMLRIALNVSDSDLGALHSLLLVVLAIASIPFGFLADRFSRKTIIAVGILLWSAATFVGGLATSFTILLIARSFVGLGEAAYAPAAQSMISGSFPQERRASAQAIFAAGMLLGGACGQVIGGIIAPRYGWQMALFVVALAGILPALALLGVEEPPRGPRSEVVPIAKLLSVPAFLSMIAGGICITFASVSLVAWAVDFAVNYKDFSVRDASVGLALTTLCSLILGVLCGGFFADRLQKRFAYGRLIVIGMALLLATPFLLLAIQSEEKQTVLLGLFVAVFFMSWYHGPVTAVIHDMMPRRAHSTSIGVYMFATQLIGGLGPQVIGRISDQRDLQVALQIATAVLVCGGLLMLLVIHFIRRDGLRHPAVEAFHAEPPETPGQI